MHLLYQFCIPLTILADRYHKPHGIPIAIFISVYPVPEIAKTSAGNLPSKHIIHVALSGPEIVKKMAKKILQLAEKDGIQSIAFPALGTGKLYPHVFPCHVSVFNRKGTSLWKIGRDSDRSNVGGDHHFVCST